MTDADYISFLHLNYTYDPLTGEFRWRINGELAGRVILAGGKRRTVVQCFTSPMWGPRAVWLYLNRDPKVKVFAINGDVHDLREANIGKYVNTNRLKDACSDCGINLTDEIRSNKNQLNRCLSCRRSAAKIDYAKRIERKGGTRPNSHVHRDEHGRVCLGCKQYLTWNSFAKNGKNKIGNPKHKATCMVCMRKTPRYTESNKYYINSTAKKRSPQSIVWWRSQKEMARIFNTRQVLHNTTGLDYHVDHIIPLRGTIDGVRLVSGLHYEGNLQILTASANMKKGGHEWPDMPNYSPQDLQELTA